MLVLSRKVGESIVLGDDVVLTVKSIDRNRVQIGIRAPSWLPIYRQEIIERMIAQGQIEPMECLMPRQESAVLTRS
jgi:carbon storage regulator